VFYEMFGTALALIESTGVCRLNVEVSCVVNGKEIKTTVRADRLLVDFLREDLGLTGTKRGCGIGECGACTVILDGRIVASCLVPAASIEGATILTVEGLSDGEKLHVLQQAFIDHGAVQCGFCTPGMLLAAKALLDKNPAPTREEIRQAIAGNVCRCTGYTKIVDAVEAAAKQGGKA
jgi:carbon-monoxide dehydrogenase small subunit